MKNKNPQPKPAPELIQSRIMISLLVLFEHGNGQRQRQHLRAEDGEPDAVNAEQGRQDEHRSGFKHQGAYSGDGGQREAQQFAVAEMVEEGDGGLVFLGSQKLEKNAAQDSLKWRFVLHDLPELIRIRTAAIS